MATQDTTAALLGSGGVEVAYSPVTSLLGSGSTEANLSFQVSLLGSASMEATEDSQKTYSVSFLGSGDMSALPTVNLNVPAIDLLGTLSSVVVPNGYNNSYIAMYGFLTADVKASQFCPDFNINMEIQEINRFCSKEASVALKRYKNNTYPIKATLSRAGDFNIAGNTFRLATQIGNGAVEVVNGTIVDPVNGIVSFVPSAAMVATVGDGTYEIEGNDGTHPYTYEKGTYTVLDTITPVV